MRKYPVDIPTRFTRDERYEIYDRLKQQFCNRYGWVDHKDYDAFIDAIVDILGI